MVVSFTHELFELVWQHDVLEINHVSLEPTYLGVQCGPQVMSKRNLTFEEQLLEVHGGADDVFFDEKATQTVAEELHAAVPVYVSDVAWKDLLVFGAHLSDDVVNHARCELPLWTVKIPEQEIYLKHLFEHFVYLLALSSLRL
jgi:hypothetical protein